MLLKREERTWGSLYAGTSELFPWCLIACTCALESALACLSAAPQGCLEQFKLSESVSNSVSCENDVGKVKEARDEACQPSTDNIT